MKTRRKAHCTRKMFCQQRSDENWTCRDEKIGARERTRTSTPLRELEPESSASASSATRALLRCVERARHEPATLRGKLILPGTTGFVNAPYRAVQNVTEGGNVEPFKM